MIYCCTALSLAHDEHERFAHLSPRERFVAAVLIRSGEADTVEEALRDWIKRRAAHERALEHRRMLQIVDDARLRKDAPKPTDEGL
jgi:hypothetical protein